MPELRQDPLSGDWVSLSGDRLTRPLTVTAAATPCPFCPGPGTEVSTEPFQVAVFDNRFPAFKEAGTSEIIVYSPDHWADLGTLDPENARVLWAAWRDRTVDLQDRRDVTEVFIFENRGRRVGATIAHPHGQLYAYPFVPPRIEREMARLAADPCPLCRVPSPDAELMATADWRVVAPYASRMPFELRLYPRRHRPDLAGPDPADSEGMALVQAILRAYDRFFGHRTALVMALYQAPAHHPARTRYHFRIDFLPIERAQDKTKYLAGSELAAGAFVGDMLPEQVAASLAPGLSAEWNRRGPRADVG